MKTYKQFLSNKILCERSITKTWEMQYQKAFPGPSGVDKMKELAKVDPTYKDGSDEEGVFCVWIWSHYKDPKFDKETVRNDLQSLIHKMGKPSAASTILQMKKLNAEQLHNYVRDTADAGVQRTIDRAIKAGAKIPFKCSYPWLVLTLDTFESSKVFGQVTHWCTTNNSSTYQDYTKNNSPFTKLYVVCNLHDGEIYQFHFETLSFMNAHDEEIDLGDFFKSNKQLEQSFKQHFSSLKPEPFMLFDGMMNRRDVGDSIVTYAAESKIFSPHRGIAFNVPYKDETAKQLSAKHLTFWKVTSQTQVPRQWEFFVCGGHNSIVTHEFLSALLQHAKQNNVSLPDDLNDFIVKIQHFEVFKHWKDICSPELIKMVEFFHQFDGDIVNFCNDIESARKKFVKSIQTKYWGCVEDPSDWPLPILNSTMVIKIPKKIFKWYEATYFGSGEIENWKKNWSTIRQTDSWWEYITPKYHALDAVFEYYKQTVFHDAKQISFDIDEILTDDGIRKRAQELVEKCISKYFASLKNKN